LPLTCKYVFAYADVNALAEAVNVLPVPVALAG